MFASTAVYTFLRLQFVMSNPYATGSETVNVVI